MKIRKKGQMAIFLSIAVIIILLTLVLFFDRIRSTRYAVSRTSSSIQDYRDVYTKTAPYLFPQITVNEYSLSRLFGYYSCYHEINFELSGYNYHLVQDTQRELDNFFEKDQWLLELNKSLCIDSNSYSEGVCKQPYRKNIYTYEFMYPLPCRTDHADGLIYLFFD